MTNRTADKTAARALAKITGDPYQSCLTAVRVLRRIPTGVELGDLAGILSGTEISRCTLNLPGSGYIDYVEFQTDVDGSTTRQDGLSVIIFATDPSPRLLMQLAGGPSGLPEGCTLWREDSPGESGLYPSGIWHVERPAFGKAVQAAQAGSGDGTVSVTASKAVDPHIYPKLFDDRRSEDAVDVAYINDKILTVIPSRTTTGPGISWAHITFADLDMVHRPVEEDHRLVNCEGDCQWLHDWPTADVSHTTMVIPRPLLDAYQRLTGHLQLDEDGLGTESHLLFEEASDGSGWYGLDMPDSSFSTLWMRVESELVQDPVR